MTPSDSAVPVEANPGTQRKRIRFRSKKNNARDGRGLLKSEWRDPTARPQRIEAATRRPLAQGGAQ